MDWRTAAYWGISLNAVGVIGLFLFGMPFRLPMRGQDMVTVPEKDPRKICFEKIYMVLGWVALGLILLGSVLQYSSVVLAP